MSEGGLQEVYDVVSRKQLGDDFLKQVLFKIEKVKLGSDFKDVGGGPHVEVLGIKQLKTA